jgi:hypothetical protein
VKGVSGEEFGECVMTRLDDPLTGPRLRIDRADRRVLITLLLLVEIDADEPLWATLRFAGAPSDGDQFGYRGSVLRVAAENRTVVYRIGEYLPERQCYVSEWPD